VSDDAYVYGFVWIEQMGRTPSEVAELPFTDVLAVNAYYKRRLPGGVPPPIDLSG